MFWCAFVLVCASESPPGGHRNGKATCRQPVTMCRVPCSLYTDSYTVIRGMFKRVTARLFAFWSLRSLAPARTGARARRGGRGASGGGNQDRSETVICTESSSAGSARAVARASDSLNLSVFTPVLSSLDSSLEGWRAREVGVLCSEHACRSLRPARNPDLPEKGKSGGLTPPPPPQGPPQPR